MFLDPIMSLDSVPSNQQCSVAISSCDKSDLIIHLQDLLASYGCLTTKCFTCNWISANSEFNYQCQSCNRPICNICFTRFRIKYPSYKIIICELCNHK